MDKKEFRKLVELAAEKLKEESVWRLLEADEGYQKDGEEEGRAEQAYIQLALTEEERKVCAHLLDCRDKLDFEYSTYAYIAGFMDAFHTMAILFPERWDSERIRKALLTENLQKE